MTKQAVMEEIEFTDTRPGGEWRSGTFFILPDKMVEDPNLSDAEYRVLSYLHRRAGNFNPGNYTDKNRKFCRVAFPTYETIAEDTNKGRQTVADILYSLKVKGYIKTHHAKTEKGIRNVYTIQFPKSYQTLDHVESFTQEVATGKTMIKRPKTESQTVSTTEEASTEFHTGGRTENHTQSSTEFLTVNKAIETRPYESGTSTYLTVRSQDQTESNQPKENQGESLVELDNPLVELDTPGLLDSESSKEGEESVSLADVVDAPASPTASPSDSEVVDVSDGPSEEFKARMMERAAQRVSRIRDQKPRHSGNPYIAARAAAPDYEKERAELYAHITEGV